MSAFFCGVFLVDSLWLMQTGWIKTGWAALASAIYFGIAWLGTA